MQAKPLIPAAFSLILCACSPTVTRDTVQTVSVPVPVACASERPARVLTLAEQFPDWDKLDVRQKAAAVSRHALLLRNYSDDLNAATAACQEVAQ